MVFLSESDKNSGGYGNLKLPLTSNGQFLRQLVYLTSSKCRIKCSCIPDENFRVTDRSKELSPYTGVG